jgi:hypothetical protein
MSRTKDFEVVGAASFQKQMETVAADLYGGANDVTLGAGHKKRFMSLNINDGTNVSTDESTNGTQIQNNQELDSVMPTFDAEHALYESGVTDLLTHALGFEALDGPKTDGASDYVHMILLNSTGKDQREYTTAEQALVSSGFDPADRINLAMHIAQNMGPSVKHAKNCYTNAFEIASSQGGSLSLKFSGTAESISRDATKSGFTSWSYPANTFARRFRHYEASISIGPIAGSISEVDCMEFAAKASFGQAEQQPTGTSNGGLSRAEPVSTGSSEVTVDVRIYKHDSDTMKGYEADQSILSLKAEYVRGTKFVKLLIPEAQVVNVQEDHADGSSLLVSLRCRIPTVAKDPFSTERTVNAVEWALPFASPLYIMASDNINTNWMRAVYAFSV